MADFGKALRGLERGLKEDRGSDSQWQRELLYLRRSLSREGSDPLSSFSPRSVLPPGEICSNALGSHYRIHASYPHDHYHGKVHLDRLSSADLESLLTL